MNSCERCKLCLPQNYLTPVIMRNRNGQTKKCYLCTNCKNIIDLEQKGKEDVK